MTSETFLYGGKTYPVVTQDGKEYADFGEKGLKLLKRNENDELVKGFPGREPGSTNGATSAATSKTGNIAPTGLWAKVLATATKQFSSPTFTPQIAIRVTNKTLTVDVGVNAENPFGEFYQPICTWSCNLPEWLAGNPGTMSASPTVQSMDGLAKIAGFGEMLDNWHK